MLIDLFKIPVYSIDLMLFNQKLLDYCFYLKDNDKECIKKSNIGGWQSKNLINDNELKFLINEIEINSNNFSKLINLKNNLKVSNIWININYFKDFNKLHHHSNTLLSGVYYIKTPDDCGNITFNHPSFDTIQYDWNESVIKKYDNYNSAEFNLKSIKSKMYIFPSWLNHSVQPNLNKNEERISISFNLK